MTRRWHKTMGWTAACLVVVPAGCAMLSNDPLSPPPVRHASRAVETVAAGAEASLPCEYRNWVREVKHFAGDTKREFMLEYQRNEAWPEPYVAMAADSVRTPLAMQAENARVQLLSLWDYHFESGTGRLNNMGRRRLHEIVDRSAGFGDLVYVRRAPTGTETAARMDVVRTELAALSPAADRFQVMEAVGAPSMISGTEAKNAVDLMTAPPRAQAGAPAASPAAKTTGAR